MPIITTLFSIIYGIGLWYWIKRVQKTVSARTTKIIIWLHFILLIAFLGICYFAIYHNTYLRGFWTTRIFVGLFLLTGTLLYPFGHKSQFTKLTKIYFGCFAIVPILTSMFLIIPFIGIVIVGSLIGQMLQTSDAVVYSDSAIRVQHRFTGLLAPEWFEIYHKDGLLEQRIYQTNEQISEIQKITTSQTADSLQVRVLYKYNDYLDNGTIIAKDTTLFVTFHK